MRLPTVHEASHRCSSGAAPGWSRWGWALLAGAVTSALTALGGCALVVGDPVGDYVPLATGSSTDGGADVKDSTAQADHVAEGSSGSRDVRAGDTGADAPLDGRAEAGQEGGSTEDAGVPDAAHDATNLVDADKTDGPDAFPSHDAGVTDAHESSAPVDAGGFCANFQVPPGMSFFCDDFDEISSPAQFGGASYAGADASVIVQSAQFLSPPNALFEAVTSANDQGSAVLHRNVSALNHLTLEFDMKVVNFYVDGPYTQFASINFASGGWISLAFAPSDSGTASSVYIIEHDAGSSGDENLFHNPVTIPLTGWTHVSMALSGGNGSLSLETVVVGGVAVDTNFELGAGFGGAPSISIGWSYVDGPGRREAYVDNVVTLSN